MRRLKSIFTENILLKIISILFAIVVWMLVVNINNPNQSRNITTSVEIINQEVLEEQGKYFSIPEGQNTVTFRVTAPRSTVEKLTSDDFYAVADMNNLEEDKRIPIDIRLKRSQSSISISSRQYYLNVNVGEKREERFVINARFTGEAAAGYAPDERQVEPNLVTVNGPENIVSKIKTVLASCDITGMSTDITENVVPEFFDANGEKIDTTKLQISVPSVNVRVSFTSIKEVPVVLESSVNGAREDGLRIGNVTIDPPNITIKGDSSVLNSISRIAIPENIINLNSLSENLETTVDISPYIPEGATVVDSESLTIKVNVEVGTPESVNIDLPVKNISMRNLAPGHHAEFGETSVRLTVTGLPSVVGAIDADSIKAHVNLSGLGTGEHHVRVEVEGKQGYTVSSSTVLVKIQNGEENG